MEIGTRQPRAGPGSMGRVESSLIAISCQSHRAPGFTGETISHAGLDLYLGALLSLHSRRVPNGVASCLGTWVSIVSKGQFVCLGSSNKVPGICWLSPIETSFTTLRARSLKSWCSRNTSAHHHQPLHPKAPGRTLPCLFQLLWFPCVPSLWLHLSKLCLSSHGFLM